jgi:TolB-like protein/rhodanese-related sulfurtransferase
MLLFHGFGFDPAGGGLFRIQDGQPPVPVPIGWRAVEVLSMLVGNPGTVLSRRAIIDKVWPGLAVEDNNLTVQISALRRILDHGRSEASCIQTVPGRGYRFAGTVSRVDDTVLAHRRDKPIGGPTSSDSRLAMAARIPLVVMPFGNLGGSPGEDQFAQAITDDLTTDLSRLPGAFVLARPVALAYQGRSVDIGRIGEELGVRYVIEGSVRKLDRVLHVNVQLISTETRANIWAGRFEQRVENTITAEEEIACRLRAALALQLLKAESARGLRERPGNPDAFDLLLRGWSVWSSVPDVQSLAEATELFEQCLRLDASIVTATCGLVCTLVNRFMIPGSPAWADEDLIERAAALVSEAASIEPDNDRLLYSQGYLLRAQARFEEACALHQRVIDLVPSDEAAYRQLAFCKIPIGQAEDAFPLLERALRLAPFSHNNRFVNLWLGYALLLARRDQAALPRLQQALEGGAMAAPAWRHRCYLYMACAHALSGNRHDARRALAEANRLWPFATVHGLPPAICGPRGMPNSALRTQVERIKEGLRRAGLRDHADEDADLGVAPTNELQVELFGLTPTTIPGAVTISTRQLAELIKDSDPLLMDVALETWGWSIPDAIGLQGTGIGTKFSEARQHRFRTKIESLTRGDRSVPIVAFCTNSERFTGYNLALRLVALGYTNVFWYRGGTEAWTLNGFPEAELSVHDW